MRRQITFQIHTNNNVAKNFQTVLWAACWQRVCYLNSLIFENYLPLGLGLVEDLVVFFSHHVTHLFLGVTFTAKTVRFTTVFFYSLSLISQFDKTLYADHGIRGKSSRFIVYFINSITFRITFAKQVYLWATIHYPQETANSHVCHKQIFIN